MAEQGKVSALMIKKSIEFSERVTKMAGGGGRVEIVVDCSGDDINAAETGPV
jgi:hypothetical protein